MRSLLRNIILNTLGTVKKISPGVHILNSHYISPLNSSQDVFYKLLKNISKQADFINIQDAVQLIKDKQPTNQKLISFTFDDGFEECYTKISPILRDFKTNAAFFINPGFIDGDNNYKSNFLENVVHVPYKKPMNWEMIKELHSEGFIIGNHTQDHERLVGLTEEEYKNQILGSKAIIEKHIGNKCDYFAWTYGKLTDIDPSALKVALDNHKYVFSSAKSENYFSCNNKVINRRHIEGNWSISHINYFLAKGKSY